MNDPLKILLLEDAVEDAELITRELTRAHMRFVSQRVQTKQEFLEALEEYRPDVILADHALPDFDGLTALRFASERLGTAAFIFVSGTLDEELAVESLKHGASDYVVKSNLRRLSPCVERALREKRLNQERDIVAQQLSTSQAMFKSLAEQSPAGIMFTDANGKHQFCNEQWTEIVGRPQGEALAMEWSEFIHPDDKERVVPLIGKLLQDKRAVAAEYRLVTAAGTMRWVNSRAACLQQPDGTVTGFIALLIDVTEQHATADKIARLNRIQAVLSGINSTIVRVADRDELLRDACHIAIDKGNFRMVVFAVIDAASGRIIASASRSTDPRIAERLKGEALQSLPEGSAVARAYVEGRVTTLDPASELEESSLYANLLLSAGIASLGYFPLILGKQKFGVIMLGAEAKDFFTQEETRLFEELAEDIAFALDHLEKEQRLNYLAYYDSLTELPNRTLFLDHLKQYVLNAKIDGEQLAVAVFDIDKFRHINVSFGEHSGDSLLKAVVARMKAAIAGTTSLGRLGSDVFGAIIPHAPGATALKHLFELRIKEMAAEPFAIGDEEISVNFKVGMALFPEDGEDAETLYQNATGALKQAKQLNQHLLFYSKEINESVGRQLKLESRLHRAIEQRQFVLYYQPKINLKTGRIGSMEALIRWNDPERGLVPPMEFIPLLEETGLIHEVGMWALQQAFDDHARLRKHFSYAPYIAVNVSAVQLQRETFDQEVTRVIGEAVDGHHGIDLEITESLIMHNIEGNIRKLRKLRNHNVHIAVDDFGTGYSSLAYIAKLPIDVLKIDRSFIVRMVESDEDRAIVSAIITLAHSLELSVVAEGVETEEQAKLLRTLHCDEAQGYLFCRPLPFEELVKKLEMSGGMIVMNS